MGEKIVFVVGAGASAEFNLPVGSDLAKQISSYSQKTKADEFGRQKAGDPILFKAAQTIANQFPGMSFIEEFRNISSGVLLMPSIDNYLHAHSDKQARVELGKLLIAYSLLISEKDSKLKFNPDNIYEKFYFANVEGTWLVALFRSLVAAGRLEQLADWLQRITFVSFNYDRVIHRFFFLATQVVFDLSEEEAYRFCEENLTVLYPYGSLGRVKPTNRNSGFGQIENPQMLISAANNLRVFTEGGEDQIRQSVHQSILDAESVWYLGFSFLHLNMEYLKPTEQTSFRVFGTLRGVSNYNSEIAKNDIASCIENGSSYSPGFNLVSTNCAQLIYDFSGFFQK